MVASPAVDSCTVEVNALAHPGLGRFELRRSVSVPNQYVWLFVLDAYQANCHRQWLEYRWTFNALAGASLTSNPQRLQQFALYRQFPSDTEAKDAFTRWVDEFLNELEQAKAA